MSDFESLGDECRAKTGANRRSCAVSDMLQSLAGEDAERVEEVLSDRRISARAINEALTRRLGKDTPSTFTIGRHRRRDCNCFRELK